MPNLLSYERAKLSDLQQAIVNDMSGVLCYRLLRLDKAEYILIGKSDVRVRDANYRACCALLRKGVIQEKERLIVGRWAGATEFVLSGAYHA